MEWAAWASRQAASLSEEFEGRLRAAFFLANDGGVCYFTAMLILSFEEFHMRALVLCLFGLVTASPDLALAQMKLPSKTAPGANEVRYFTAIDGLMDGNADVILKETRQGKTVTAAVLDAATPPRRVPTAKTVLSPTSPSAART